ncbi:MAG: hypothetical protein MUC97_15270 [Bernardetiaceae bacterium]|nr:hypothetical protein [Bernardetiaceae bacterium]
MKISSLSKIVLAAWFFLAVGAHRAVAQTDLAQAGKIWYDEGFLYVNILNEGVMVINNYDPTAPRKVGFISIPGNVDMAVRGTTLYANSHQDLVAIDIRDLKNVKEIARVPAVFTHRPRQNSWDANTIAFRNGQDLVNMINQMFNPIAARPNNNGRNNNNANRPWWMVGGSGINQGINGNGLAMSATPNATKPASNPGSVGGKGGSMACFTLMDNFLYAIDSRDLLVFDIKEAAKLQLLGNKIPVNTDIETIFGYNDRLFIGSQTGMYIYNATNRQAPQREGHYRHTRSCDPVVVEGDYAYVTLRDGSDCGGNVNQLDVIDISNPSNPRKIQTYPMTNPHGLGIDNGTLFVCDGRDGLKVFDATDVRAINRNQIAHFRDINTYDVIPDNLRKVLMLVGSNRITQYDYKDPRAIAKLSEIDLRRTDDVATATNRK